MVVVVVTVVAEKVVVATLAERDKHARPRTPFTPQLTKMPKPPAVLVLMLVVAVGVVVVAGDCQAGSRHVTATPSGLALPLTGEIHPFDEEPTGTRAPATLSTTR